MYKMNKYLLVILTISLISSCSREKHTEKYFSCVSPNGNYKATFYREYGGGAAGWQYLYVSIKEKNDKPSVNVLKMSHGYSVSLEWLNEHELKIGYPSKASIHHWQNLFGSDVKNNIKLFKAWKGKIALNDSIGGCQNKT